MGKSKENEAFVREMLAAPVRPKVDIKLDGGAVCRCDAELAPSIISVQERIRTDAEIFHKKLLSLGVKAYRVNDGWVDRKKRIVTLFNDEHDYGYYYRGEQNINVGDLIAIGTVYSGAMIVKVVEKCVSPSWCIELRYGEEVLSVVDGVKDGKDLVSEYHPTTQSKLMSKLGLAKHHRYPIYED